MTTTERARAQTRKEKMRRIREEDIVSAAERVFFSKGFSGSTMDEVAREAEYSKRTIYSYFTSKEQIYDAIINRAFQIQNRMFTEALRDASPTGGLDKVIILGKTCLEFAEKFPNYFEATIYYDNKDESFVAQDEIKTALYREGDIGVTLLIECIREGMADGSIAGDFEPASLAFVLYANIIGIGSIILKKEKYIRHSYQKSLPDLIAEQFKFIIKGLKP